jgi:Asp-tRNA(Asn)/Glu-tRNA(Gln) amidotransferase A subunit family amidase
MAERDRLVPAVQLLYRDVDVLVTPAAPFVAPVTTPPIDTPDGEVEGFFSCPFNLTGDPALVLPCGFDPDGLPIGLQLSAARGADMALLAHARVVEGLLEHTWRPPAVS